MRPRATRRATAPLGHIEAAELPVPTRLLIVFYSRTGSVEALAGAAAEGAREAGAEVRLRRAREVAGEKVVAASPGWLQAAERMDAAYPAPTKEDAEWADAILFGSPSYFGAVSAELKAYLDQLGPQWKEGALANKAGGAFASASWPHGGAEVVMLSLYASMAHLGMVIVPTGYTDPSMQEAGSPYGAVAIAGSDGRLPRPEELDAARHQARRTVGIAGTLAAGQR